MRSTTDDMPPVKNSRRDLTVASVIGALLLLCGSPSFADDVNDDIQDQPVAVTHAAPIRHSAPVIVQPRLDPDDDLAPDDSQWSRPSTKAAPLKLGPHGPTSFTASYALPLFLRGTLTAPGPFPIVVTASAMPLRQLAPGIRSFKETLFTTSGPLVVSGILADPRVPGVHFETVLAHDEMVSPGEVLTSMAQRTGAVAGINGDYFAIHQTNEPLGLVVHDGTIWRSPGRRVALSITEDNTIQIMPFHFNGTVSWDTFSIPLTGINTWPPDGGAALILPNFGHPRLSLQTVHFLHLAPIAQTANGSTYRVLSDTTNRPEPNTLGLALGPAALKLADPPQVGSTILMRDSLVPNPTNRIVTAIGGGPQLLAGHTRLSTGSGPLNDEIATGTRFPLSGIGRLDDGELLLLAVDGRQPTRSVGLTRAEFAALFQALGAVDAMCLDSGGSTTMVARDLNDPWVHLFNTPSNGGQRPIGDAFMVYSNNRFTAMNDKPIDSTSSPDLDPEMTPAPSEPTAQPRGQTIQLQTTPEDTNDAP